MNANEIKSAIKVILLSHGSVTFGYKTSVRNWAGEVKIAVLSDDEDSDDQPPHYMVYGEVSLKQFEDIDDAIQYFASHAYGKINLFNAYRGLAKRGLDQKADWEHPGKYEEKLVANYNEKYFDADYPFAKDFE